MAQATLSHDDKKRIVDKLLSLQAEQHDLTRTLLELIVAHPVQQETLELEPTGDTSTTPVERLVAIWNDRTSRPIPSCREISKYRRQKLTKRLGERVLDQWTEIIDRIQASAFCRGDNERGWVADIDWLIGSPDPAVRVLEGKYDDRKTKGSRADLVNAVPVCPHTPPCDAPGRWSCVMKSRREALEEPL